MSLSSRRTKARIAVAVLALLTGTPMAAAAADGSIELRVSGDPGGSFTAECSLTTEGKRSSFSLVEAVPYDGRFVGSGLRCRIEAAGAIEVEVTQGGNRTRSRTSGGVVTVSVGG